MASAEIQQNTVDISCSDHLSERPADPSSGQSESTADPSSSQSAPSVDLPSDKSTASAADPSNDRPPPAAADPSNDRPPPAAADPSNDRPPPAAAGQSQQNWNARQPGHRDRVRIQNLVIGMHGGAPLGAIAGGGRGGGGFRVRPQLIGLLRWFQSISLRNFLSSQMSSRVILLLSLVATISVVANAFSLHKQFYPMGVLYAQAIVLGIMIGKLVTHILFGRLRTIELDTIVERVWFALTETMLAFTIFRDDLTPKFIGLFIFLLFVKSYHWLAEERIDVMERSTSLTKLFHVRIVTVLILLNSIDTYMVLYSIDQTNVKGLLTVDMVFGFEYAILCTLVVHVLVKYVLNLADIVIYRPRVAVWERKVTLLMYTEVIVSFVKLILYILFMGVLMNAYAVPLFTVRPVYLTLRSFKRALTDIIMSRKAIEHMNKFYPDATGPELEAMTDNTCIICRDEMHAGNVKKLPCSHIFHTSCLRSWFQRQQTCPTCRLDVLSSTLSSSSSAAGARSADRSSQANADGARQNGGSGGSGAAGAGNAGNNSNPSAAAVEALRQRFFLHHSGSSRMPSFITGSPSQPPQPPPPPMPPMSSGDWPMPDPPENLATLTDAELVAMEGRTRAAVEARIKCLRNIQILLDASAMQMQQYHAIVDRLSAQQEGPSGGASDKKDATKSVSEGGIEPVIVNNTNSGSKDGVAVDKIVVDASPATTSDSREAQRSASNESASEVESANLG